jgi:hypothetical protein
MTWERRLLVIICVNWTDNRVKSSGLATSEEKTGQESVSEYGEQGSTVPLKMQWTVTFLKMQQILR